ncbi:disease resistance protein RGA2-like [Gossypium australe]|uniref:Disease resistance protein RGA2-like n=1 Tax=Gossypium australe TaxID=47621 RepID=A0A5B6W003_9ROSI|nr:disease resistance protein RGA2-like [Gossypium australe]
MLPKCMKHLKNIRYLDLKMCKSLSCILKKLCIKDYQGVQFPYWMMNMLLPNLVEILLLGCGKCDQLPPVRKLLESRHPCNGEH